MLSATQCKIKFTLQTHCISNKSQYALRPKGVVVSYVFLLLTSIYLILNEGNTPPCLGFSSDLVPEYLNMFSSDHYQGKTMMGGRAEEILNNPLLNLSFCLRKPQLRFDPQKPATHLARTRSNGGDYCKGAEGTIHSAQTRGISGE